MAKDADIRSGYGVSGPETFTIGSGADGSLVDPVDFGRNVAYVLISCADASNIQAATTLGLEVAYGDDDNMVTLKERDSAGAYASDALPTSGDFGFACIHALGAQRVRLVLSQVTSGGSAVFKVWGLFQGIKE